MTYLAYVIRVPLLHDLSIALGLRSRNHVPRRVENSEYDPHLGRPLRGRVEADD
jgi:hypothetical protein